MSPVVDDSSELTHGRPPHTHTHTHTHSLYSSTYHCAGTDQVMCGNPVRALKARRRRGLFSQVKAWPNFISAWLSSLSLSLSLSLSTQSSVAMSPWYSPSHVGSRPEEQSVTMATSVVDIESQTDQLTLSPSPPPPPPSLACGAGTLWTTAARPLSADPRHRRYRRPSPSDSRSERERESVRVSVLLSHFPHLRPASQVDTLDLRSPTLPSQKLFNKFEQ